MTVDTTDNGKAYQGSLASFVTVVGLQRYQPQAFKHLDIVEPTTAQERETLTCVHLVTDLFSSCNNLVMVAAW